MCTGRQSTGSSCIKRTQKLTKVARFYVHYLDWAVKNNSLPELKKIVAKWPVIYTRERVLAALHGQRRPKMTAWVQANME
jgi:hypothetical protein